MWFYRAVALDLDGTLAVDDHISDDTLAAIDAAREDRAVLLVTGRIQRDLDRVFPGLVDHFDAVVTENGAVLTRPHQRLLHEPVDPAVNAALVALGIGTDLGEVLVAIEGRHATTATEVIAGLGLDHQVVHNRGAAMILPAETTKGTGLLAGLSALGLGAHNAVAVGDAENDLTLLRTAELGVAVANAVPSLAEHADLVLDRPDGAGVAQLLTGPILAGLEPLWPPRRHISIGSLADGSAAWLPGSQASVLVTGESISGKSYLAGLLAERWMDAGYSVLVIDPEGDHVGLAQHEGVDLISGPEQLPHPHSLLAHMGSRRLSVVLDLSCIDADDRSDYLSQLPSAIAAERTQRGVPHWVIYDEAHQQSDLDQSQKLVAGPGDCLVTWRPELLNNSSTRRIDITITTTGTHGPGRAAATGSAILSRPDGQHRFRIGERLSTHVRHQHKYAATPLPHHRRFFFQSQNPEQAVATLEEFHNRLEDIDPATFTYHAARRDFSRWIADTLADEALAALIANIEREVIGRRAAAVETARQRVRQAVRSRYLQD
ncbi:MAG: HAD hydrolase family protein [Dermatophilaceae bacterium]|nr:HAD hydrolase family protein [Intrasporangiaceae bacterium]